MVQRRARLVRLSLVGLFVLAHACRSGEGSGGGGASGHGGSPGTAGGAGTGGAGAGLAGAGLAGTGGAGTSGAAGGGLGGGTRDGGPAAVDGGGDAHPDAGGAGPFYPLDMNDVTILVPLPQSIAAPVLVAGTDLADDGTSFVPRALFDHLATDSLSGQPLPFAANTYERLQLVAVRFDLCDRHLPGECPVAEDARMRLVFQPVSDVSGADDVGFHAFYAIRNDEIAGAVAALRDLARTGPARTGALRISPALGAGSPDPYATKLRAFVNGYGGDSRLVRLTMNARDPRAAALVWVFRGVEKTAQAFVDMPIVGATTVSESVTLAGGTSYAVNPATDTPPGFLRAVSTTTFNAADPPTQRAALAALVVAENPLSHTTETVACAACHVATAVMNARAMATAMDPLTLPGRYTSTFDLSVAAGKSADTPLTLRALGYLAKVPMIAQRVANDTAQTLTEIEKRYPPP
jgi:hypothetical protein